MGQYLRGMNGAGHYVVPVMFSPLVRPDRLSAVLRACLRALRRRGLSTWWREIALIGVLYAAYEFSRGLGDVDVKSALSNGSEILHLERVWHLAPEHVLNQALTHMTVLAVAASYFYSLMHYIVTPAVLIWMYRSHKAQYGFARTALALSTAIGLVGYLVLPTAPPRMVNGSGLSDILADTQNWGWWSDDGSVPKGLGDLTNQFAAMPSLHVGWALAVAIALMGATRSRWRRLWLLHPLITLFVVLVTGNHYWLDAIVATVLLSAVLAVQTGWRPATAPVPRPRLSET
jgi:PAP2 superfamily